MATYNGYAILREALTHLGEEYYLGIVASYTDSTYGRLSGQGFDCAEFATYCAYQAYGVSLGLTQHASVTSPGNQAYSGVNPSGVYDPAGVGYGWYGYITNGWGVTEIS